MPETLMRDHRARLLQALQRRGTAIADPGDTLAGLIAMARAAGSSEDTILQSAAEVLGIRYLTMLSGDFLAEFAARIPISFAREHKIIALSNGDARPILALGDLTHWDKADVVSRMLQRSAEIVLADPEAVAAAIDAAYQQQTGRAQEMIHQLDRNQVLNELEHRAGREDLLDVADRAPVVKLVNLILFEAVEAGASDVHIQPRESKLVVRMRIDGVLYDTFTVPQQLQAEIISRVKVMGRMNIAEKRLPQDGRATVQVGDRMVDLRIASLPTSHGERVVLRLLDKSTRTFKLGEIGMEARMLKVFRQLITIDHGMILVSGPTGSGKSTTLYSALGEINSTEQNILTLEDPIEFQLEGISQTQINEKKGMTFAMGLRNVLRQDPDIIMVGEIRDRETAVMAVQSALTGHLVFSTLHTNDAASAVARLLDLGIEPYLASSSLTAVLAQRLVRRVCPHCDQPFMPCDTERATLGVSVAETRNMRTGRGCAKCRNTGYRGRLGTFELLVVDDVIRGHIQQRSTAAEIRRAAIAAGMRSLRDDGIAKVLAGVTTLAEVQRVTMRTASTGDGVAEDEEVALDPTEPPPMLERDVPVAVTTFKPPQ
jgi:general secretion pathway protein E